MEKKTWRQLHKNSTGCSEQILVATSHNTAAVQPPTTHLENHPSRKPSKLDEQDMRNTAVEVRTGSKRCAPVDIHTDEQGFGQPDRTYLQQLCIDTGSGMEDLPGAMNDGDEWQES